MLSIVVPVHNGKDNLLRLVERITAASAAFGRRWELIFVDDGSSDGSMEQMKALAGADPGIGWIRLDRNYGQQTAVLCGLRHSSGERVVTIDDDLEHPPEVIAVLSAELEKGFEAVYAIPGTSSGVGSSIRDLFFTLFLGKPAGLRIGSFRIFSRTAVEAICRASSPFVYISAELFRQGFRIGSITYSRPAADSDGCSSSRYSTVSRFRLYLRLLRWYGPVLRRIPGRNMNPQYEIAEKGGCL